MRKITIHQSDAENINILDDSDEPIEQFCNKLSELMKMGNVAIVKTSSASVVLRPSKVVGIKVEEKETSQTVDLPPEENQVEEKQEETEDIITDVDH